MEIPYTLAARPDTGLYNGKLGVWLFLASEVMLFGAIFTAYLFVRLGAEDGTWPNHVQNVALGFSNTVILIISSITMVWAWVSLKERKFTNYRVALGITILCGLVFLCIKMTEYYQKYEHFGFQIKEDAIGKYEPELKKMNAYYCAVPSEHTFEVRGHLHAETPDSFTIVPDENPKYLYDFAKKSDTAPAADESSGGEEQTLTIAQSDVERYGRLLPKYGTYYAIYFLVTGLHALHIVGGVVVMLYFFTVGSALYRRNPEQLSNRIEVTGIFWHFVDLVWITVFPILYLT
ncbi:MAG: cytochrome c oxidase subunit 3 [Methylacidiphilales bacterium]|nr:cytochrome c oxidase subunit 3 [Candidatus Methylacidiphilales bacterium]